MTFIGTKIDRKKTVISFVFLFSMLVILNLFYFFSEGFTFSKIESFTQDKIAYNSGEIPPNVFNQKFSYLGKGAQVYVFLSEDQKHVLKIYRKSKYSITFFDRFFSFSLNQYLSKKERLDYNQKKSLESYPISYEFLKPITGLVYMHLMKTTNLFPKVVLEDKLKRKRTLSLDDYIFLIQKRARPLKEKLHQFYLNHDEDNFKKYLISYGKAILFRIDNQIADRDFLNALRNAGVYENQVIFMDVGGFYKNPILKTKERKEQEIQSTLKNLEDFIKKNMPEMKSCFDGVKHNLLQESNS